MQPEALLKTNELQVFGTLSPYTIPILERFAMFYIFHLEGNQCTPNIEQKGSGSI